MKRDVLHSPRLSELKKRRRKAVLNKFLIILLGLFLVFALSAYLSRLEGLNINQIKILGNKVIEANTIQSATLEAMEGKYLWLFPKTNILYYPKSSIKNALQEKFHRLDTIDLSTKERKVLTVSITEREAKYLWCGVSLSENLAKEKEKCYFLDKEGYLFDEAPYFSGEVYFKFYGKKGINTENPIGSSLSEKNFAQLISFKDILISIGLKPVVINILENGDIELFLAKGERKTLGPKILLNPETDFQKMGENLQAALSTEPLLSGFKNKYSSLLYIDLRFGNKVYFKFLPASGGQ